jgi:hypothetical protein
MGGCLQGVVVLDEKYEEISLRVEFSDVEGQLALNPSGGQLAQVSRTHSEVVSGELADSDTVWIGGIPHDVIGQVSQAEAAPLDDTNPSNKRIDVLTATPVRPTDGMCAEAALGVPAGQDEGGASLSAELLGQLGAYGELISHTVRVKEGAAKSWALVTFQVTACHGNHHHTRHAASARPACGSSAEVHVGGVGVVVVSQNENCWWGCAAA